MDVIPEITNMITPHTDFVLLSSSDFITFYDTDMGLLSKFKICIYKILKWKV